MQVLFHHQSGNKIENHKLIEKKMTLRLIKNKIHKLGVTKIDYIKILDTDKLKSTYNKKTNCKIFIAYYLGKIRLIDNI